MTDIIEINKAKSEITESVTFKVSVNDKQKLQNVADELQMSLSEFIRIKLLLDDINLQKLISENIELKKQVKENLVRTTMPTSDIADGRNIGLRTTDEGIIILRKFLSEIKYNNRIMPQTEYMDNEDIAMAFSIIISQHLVTYHKEFKKIRKHYGITSYDQFYKLIFEPYFDSVFKKKSKW